MMETRDGGVQHSTAQQHGRRSGRGSGDSDLYFCNWVVVELPKSSDGYSFAMCSSQWGALARLGVSESCAAEGNAPMSFLGVMG